MKRLEKNVREVKEYAIWLSEQLDELCITQQEIADAIGVSQKTISRYKNGDNGVLPDEHTKALIEEYIYKSSTINEFEHIPSKEFADILYVLLEEFEVSENEFAKTIGISQNTINKLVNHKLKIDTATQFEILDYFLERCRSGRFYSSVHINTGANLEYLLYGYDKNNTATYLVEECNVKIGERGGYRYCIDYILKLPIKIQDFICEHIRAFYDDIFFTQTIYGGEELCSFSTYCYAMELYRQLPKKQQETIISKLEEYSHIVYPQDFFDDDLFSCICDYYCAINCDIPRLNKSRNCLRGKKSTEDFVEKIERELNYESIGGASVIDDKLFVKQIQYKLTLTRHEWYVWMLFFIYDYKETLYILCDEMKKIIHKIDFPCSTI